MANFRNWIYNQNGRRYNRIFGSPYFQDVNWDKGNYSNGFLIGTSRSIAADNFIEWKGLAKPTTQAEANRIKQMMINLTAEEAVRFYKPEIWDKVKGDLIENQTIAEFTADAQSSIGYNAAKYFNKALFNLGYTDVPQSARWSEATILAANRADPQKLYVEFYDQLYSYYNSLQRRERFIKDLNKYYPRDRVVERGGGVGLVSIYQNNKAQILIILGLLGLVWIFAKGRF